MTPQDLAKERHTITITILRLIVLYQTVTPCHYTSPPQKNTILQFDTASTIKNLTKQLVALTLNYYRILNLYHKSPYLAIPSP